jgi:hypothetical protein
MTHNFYKHLVFLLANLVVNNKITFQFGLFHSGEFLKLVNISNNIRQGFSLSFTLFIIAINLLVRNLAAVGVTLAYVDDICLLLKSIKQVNQCIKIFEDFCLTTNMKINVLKSAVLSNNKNFKPFYFFNIEIPSLEFYKYLGFN